MNGNDSLDFGARLRQFRRNAGLTQEELAGRANVSTRTISDLERGISQFPYRATVDQLAQALSLPPTVATVLHAAAQRRRGPRAEPRRAGAHLPQSSTPILGRDRDEAVARRLLAYPDVRLLTLTGVGGVGKTRLALEIAARTTLDYADGVFFVPLAAIRDPAQVPGAMGGAMDVREEGDTPLHDRLIERCGARQMLLVLDNFEQVCPAGAYVSTLLASCPRLKVLVTSRAPLEVRGEQELQVLPLAVPPAGDAPLDVEELHRYSAIALLVQRAQAILPTFGLDTTNAAAVAEICRRLDGLPLALELAAAHLRVLSPQALVSRLGHSLDMLTQGARDAPDRQRTLRSTIEWSYGLLRREEQLAFRRIAAINGWCTVAAAAACFSSGDVDALTWLTSLVKQSLLTVGRQSGGEPQFLMMETIREYALDRLALSGERDEVMRRLGAYYISLVKQAGPELRGAQQREWLARLEDERFGIQAVLEWACTGGDVDVGLQIAGVVWWYWYTHGQLSEGRRWLEALLFYSDNPKSLSSLTRARALYGASVLAAEQSEYDRAATLSVESLSAFKAIGDTRGAARSLTVLGNVATYQGKLERATSLYREALEAFRDAQDDRSIALELNNLANVAKEEGRFSEAVDLYRESLTVRTQLEDRRGIGITLNNMAMALLGMGQPQEAAEAAAEALSMLRELSDKDVSRALDTLARLRLEEGDIDGAARLYREGLVISWAVGDKDLIAFHLEGMGRAAAAGGKRIRGVHLCAAAAATRERVGATLSPSEREWHERNIQTVRSELDRESFESAWREGQSWVLSDAIAVALEDNSRPN